MMKLYYTPGACSLSPHITLRESGLPFELALVNLKTHQLADGTDFYAINPNGYVPLLELDNGERLTEGPAILQYIADQAPGAGLAPPADSFERYRLQEWLGFINSELHKGFSPLFNPATPEEYKAVVKKKLGQRFAWVDGQLAGRDYLMGDRYTVPDGYLYVMTRWAGGMGIDLAPLANLSAFAKRMEARPAVQAALQAEKDGSK